MKIKVLFQLVMLLLGFRKDERLGFRVIGKLAHRIVPGYQLTWPELAWFRSAKLLAVLHKYGEGDGFNAHRRLALQQLLRLVQGVPGDTAECGVYMGCGSDIILQANGSGTFPRHHFIFDSFEGVSAPTSEDGHFWKKNDLAAPETAVRRNLGPLDSYTLLKGWIPSRFDEVGAKQFCFVHVDVDLYQPTQDSLRFFYERLNAGGIFVCDDYGFLTCPGATQAIDEFLAERPEKMVALAGGGGFFIKGCVTAGE